jgi:uncharacterized protein YukE
MGGAGEAMALEQQRQAQQKKADQQWQGVLKAHQGGQYNRDGFTTDFETAGGFKGLQAMIEHANPDAMQAVSEHYTAIAGMLQETSQQLSTHVNNMLENWSGQSADNFRASAETLYASLDNGSQYATNASTAIFNASSALRHAQKTFPKAPSELDQIGSALGGSSDIQFKQDAATMGLEKAVQKDGGDLSAWEQVHQQAVVVMEELGRQYNNSTFTLNQNKTHDTGAGVWPAPPNVTKPTGPIGNGGGTPRSPRQSGRAGLEPITGGNAGGHDNFRPGQYDGHGYLPGGGGIEGVHGGQPGGTPPGIGGKLDGGIGGLRSGIGGGDHLGGGSQLGGLPGLGMGGGGAGGGAFGGRFGGMGGLGAGLGSDHLGGSAEGGSAHGLSEKAAGAHEGEGAGAAGEGEGMGMGGAGGLGQGKGNKKKRKARAGYLVEDEETWTGNAAANPGVIDF